MINLLPPKEKKESHLRQIKKLIIILGSAIIIIIICLIFILLSVNYYILGTTVSQKFILGQAESRYTTDEFLKYKNILQDYNKSIAKIQSFYKDGQQLHPVLYDVLNIERPSGMYFINLALTRKEKSDNIEVKISGSVDTRDSLLIFKKNIEGNARVKSSNFSPESWINPTNISFNLTLEINEN